jgi:putative FmdB family regulatory protein
MPVYCYKCEKCGSVQDEYFKRAGKKFVKCNLCGEKSSRDLSSQFVNSPEKEYDRPVLSEAMGVHANQVAQHRQDHPDIPITDDGRVICRSHAERKRIMKKLGFIDRDSYC